MGSLYRESGNLAQWLNTFTHIDAKHYLEDSCPRSAVLQSQIHDMCNNQNSSGLKGLVISGTFIRLLKARDLALSASQF